MALCCSRTCAMTDQKIKGKEGSIESHRWMGLSIVSDVREVGDGLSRGGPGGGRSEERGSRLMARAAREKDFSFTDGS